MTSTSPAASDYVLPLIGRTSDVDSSQSHEHWNMVFGNIWGDLDIRTVHDGNISGSLHSRKIGNLTFNRIQFGNQQFERSHNKKKHLDDPFFSLTFPESGTANCQIGDTQTRLVPKHAYLLNNGLAAKLKVERDYSTFNVKIPISALEHRIGRNVGVLSRTIVQPDAIFHMMQRLITELLNEADELDEVTAGFMTNQMLDTVAFFMTSGGGGMSNDSLAIQAVRARVVAFLDSKFCDPSLSPQIIAQACGISRSYLYKVFAEGPSVMERLKTRRLEAARSMIEMCIGSQPLTEIAMVCGFSNSSEFSRLFKLQYGVKPSKY